MERALREVEDVSGEYLEFGIALGGSGILIARAASRVGAPFVGFDVFGMIPPPSPKNDPEDAQKRYETISGGGAKGIDGETYYGYRQSLFDEVLNTFARFGVHVDGEMIQLRKGLFQDTVPSADIGPVAFCHIDCDWYDPVKFCLEQIGPKIALGGAIVLDDYQDWGGCTAATDEFLAANPEFEKDDGPNVILWRRKTRDTGNVES